LLNPFPPIEKHNDPAHAGCHVKSVAAGMSRLKHPENEEPNQLPTSPFTPVLPCETIRSQLKTVAAGVSRLKYSETKG
jgi:hypothetical protein